METQSNSIQVRLVDLVPHNDEFIVPAGTIAFFDGDSEKFKFQGKLTNHGTLLLAGNTEIAVDALVNKGKVQCENGNVTLRTNFLDTDGEIESPQSISVIAHPEQDLRVTARAGTFEAPASILLQADKNITVNGGTFCSGEIRVNSACGNVKVYAKELDGPVYLKGANGLCGAERGEVIIKEQCFSADPFFYCTSGPMTVDGQSTGEDFVVYALGDIVINGSISTPKRLILAAGFSFQPPQPPEFPNPGNDCGMEPGDSAPCDGNLLPLIFPAQPATITVNGSLTGDRVSALSQGAIHITGAVNANDLVQIDTGELGTGELKVDAPITFGSGGASINGRHGATTIMGDITGTGPISMIGDADDGNDLTVDGQIESSAGAVFISKKGTIDLKKDLLSMDDLRLQNVKEDGETKVKGKLISSDGKIEVFTKGSMDIASDPDTEVKAGTLIKLLVDDESNGKVTVGGKITAEDGELEVRANGSLEIKDETKAEKGFVYLHTKTDTLNAGDSETTIKTKKITAPGSNVVLRAGSKISTETIDVSKTDGSNFAGAIDISANLAEGTADEFIIGDTASDNGVKGSLLANTDNGGNADPDRITGGVRVFSKGTGNVRLVAQQNIQVTASASRNGVIILDADTENNGQVILPGGTLSVNGSGNNGAGAIILLGSQVKAEGGSKQILAANHTDADKLHFITIAAETLMHGGTGLEISVNGDRGLVELLPKGAVEVISNMDPSDLSFEIVRPNGIDGTDGLLDITGSGTLDVSCNGSNCNIFVSGNPVKLRSGDDVNFFCNGEENHTIGFKYQGPNPTAGGLLFQTAKQVTFAANGTAGTVGGLFSIDMPKVSVDTTKQVRVETHGEGAGTGGLISIIARNGDIDVADTRKVRLFANAGTSGATGGIININAQAQSAQLNLQDTRCEANGTTGAGGTITLNGETVNLNSVTFVANAGTDGNGGQIFVNGVDLTVRATLPAPADDSRFIAMGGTGTGNGGGVRFDYSNNITVQNKAVADVSANGSGAGGTLRLIAHGQLLNLDSTGITLRANAAGPNQVRGGTIELTAGQVQSNGSLTSKATVRANGSGTGFGGEIFFNADNLDLSDGPISANGGAVGLGGGAVNFNALNSAKFNNTNATSNGGQSGPGADVRVNSSGATGTVELLGTTSLAARGGTNGGFGGRVMVQAGGDVTIDANANIDVDAVGGNEPGGKATITTDSRFICHGLITANGRGFREGGEIKITANGMTIDAAAIVRSNGGQTGAGNVIELVGSGSEEIRIEGSSVLRALGGNTDGGGGQITISNQGNIFVAENAKIDGGAKETDESSGNGSAGTLTITTPEQLTFNGIARANGAGTGRGGNMVISAARIDLSNSVVRSNGGSSGGGGDIQISATSNVGITADAVILTAKGGSVIGDGGSITLDSDGPLDIGIDSVISVAATDQATGLLGFAPVKAGNLSFRGSSITKKGLIDSSGKGMASGNTITFESDSYVDLSEAQVEADGGALGGKGGNVIVRYNSSTPVKLARVSARSVGAGDGGTIELENKLASTDLTVEASGDLITSNSSQPIPKGELILKVQDTFFSNITVNVAGSLRSNVTATAGSISIFGRGNHSIVGVKSIKGSSASGANAVTIEAVGDLSKILLLDSNSKIESFNISTILKSALIFNAGTIQARKVSLFGGRDGSRDQYLRLENTGIISTKDSGGQEVEILAFSGLEFVGSDSGTILGKFVFVSTESESFFGTHKFKTQGVGTPTGGVTINSNAPVTVQGELDVTLWDSSEPASIDFKYSRFLNEGTIRGFRVGFLAVGQTPRITNDGVIEANLLFASGAGAPLMRIISSIGGVIKADRMELQGQSCTVDQSQLLDRAGTGLAVIDAKVGGEVSGEISIRARDSGYIITNAHSRGGNLNLRANGGALILGGDSTVIAEGGSIFIRNDNVNIGEIIASSNSVILSTGGTISVTLGAPPPTPVMGIAPPCVIENKANGGQIFYGNNSIGCSGMNTINVDGSQVVFNTRNRPSSAIVLGGNVLVEAS